MDFFRNFRNFCGGVYEIFFVWTTPRNQSVHHRPVQPPFNQISNNVQVCKPRIESIAASDTHVSISVFIICQSFIAGRWKYTSNVAPRAVTSIMEWNIPRLIRPWRMRRVWLWCGRSGNSASWLIDGTTRGAGDGADESASFLSLTPQLQLCGRYFILALSLSLSGGLPSVNPRSGESMSTTGY